MNWAFLLEEMCWSDRVLVERVYWIFMFELLQNFQVEASRVLRMRLIQYSTSAETSSHAEVPSEKQQITELGGDALCLCFGESELTFT